ncbi:MAG: hypothetical protein KKF41_14320 [Actinobacteria bacterium]|nr:hypothetical protein [Actinomycetota bacterium]MBU1942575.1 hypothetical protein [Actinomycetota bacterium]MBU2688749.1 hypothetical protein [Actinomycetota bacterium]
MAETTRRAERECPPGEGAVREFLLGTMTDLCVSMPDVGRGRTLPSWVDASHPRGVGPAPSSPGDVGWLEPFPDDLLPQTGLEIPPYEPRESVSLEFVGALQGLSPPARARLLLGHEDSPPADIEADHAAFEYAYDREAGRREPPPEADAGPLLMRYIFNWESAGPEGMEAMLSDGVVLQNVPSGECFIGRDEVLRHLATGPLRRGEGPLWRLLPRRANGQMAFGAYVCMGSRQPFASHSIQVLYFDGSLVSEMIVFEYPRLFNLFDLLDELAPQGVRQA